MGSMQPTFRVIGNKYVYTQEQNSYYEKSDKKPQAICEGTLRFSAIDSILNIVKDIQDTLVYRTNIGISCGGIHHISVRYEKTKMTFGLLNASDPRAQKIVEILNTNIPADKPKLWLFNFLN